VRAYRGDPARTDLLSGQSAGCVRDDRLTIEHQSRQAALAITTITAQICCRRAVACGFAGYEASSWNGLCAPKATPADIVDRLNREVNASLANPKIKARLNELGGPPVIGSPADFGRIIADDTEKWARVVKFSGAKPS
jgi:hypothetical protein